MASPTINKVGPCGGDGGDVKDMIMGGITRIVKISIRHDAVIDALTVHFLRNGRQESTERWGGGGGREEKFNLKASEYITSVKGYIGMYKDWIVVRSLKFETNMRSLGPYGQEEGTPFELPAIGGKIIGFHGRSTGLLDALGVYVQTSTQVLTVGPFGGCRGSVNNMPTDGITRIVKIRIRHGGAIDALTVHFLHNGLGKTRQWGGQGGDLTEFDLQDSEYITSIEGRIGYYETYFVVRSLTFKTNLGSTFGPYGTEEGVPFEVPAIDGKIIGFHGRSAGLLDALGVYVQVNTLDDSLLRLRPNHGCFHTVTSGIGWFLKSIRTGLGLDNMAGNTICLTFGFFQYELQVRNAWIIILVSIVYLCFKCKLWILAP